MAENNKLYGMGRRKTAVAQVVLNNDSKDRTVNGIPMEEYFPTSAMQQVVLRSLITASQNDEYGFNMKIKGGGKHAQSEAASLSIARALLEVDPGYRKQLKKTGLLTRDPRMKERKKPGLKRARRAPQFSKR